MKILVVTQYFWPENFRINDWVDGMVERGHEVTVLTSLPNYPKGVLFEEYKKDPSKFNQYKNVEVIRVPQILRGSRSIQLALNYISFAFFGSTIGLWKLRNKQFDVSFVFAVSPILMVIPAIFIKVTKKTPILLWVLDLWPDVLKSLKIIKSNLILKILSKFVSFLYYRCDSVVAQSSMFFDDIKKIVPQHNNLDYINSWSEKESNNIKSDFNILYTGNIGESQDFKTIIQAAINLKNYPKIKWFIVGDGRMFEWLKDQVKQYSLENTVHLLGAYPIEKMAIFFKYSTVSLLCLKDDEILCKTIPGKLQTYFFNANPVVGACSGEVFNIVNNHNAGLICKSGDSQHLSDNILKLSHLSALDLNIMRNNAKNYYSKYFDRDLILNSFEKKLLSIIK
jgi:glycosyltransferase involved in cell wall biosynthesis